MVMERRDAMTHAGGYRGGDALVRVHEQEAELACARSEVRALQRKLSEARGRLRGRRALGAGALAGYGALVGNLLGGVAYLVSGDAWMMPIASIPFALFAFVIGHSWNPVDDGFPDAPPPRGLRGR